MSPPKKVKGRTPNHQGRPSTNQINGHHATTVDSKAYRRQDGYTAPTSADRGDQAVIDAAEARGFRVAVRCLDCGHWLASPASVSAHRGPRCRARLGGV